MLAIYFSEKDAVDLIYQFLSLISRAVWQVVNFLHGIEALQ